MKKEEVKECFLRWTKITGPWSAGPCDDVDFVHLFLCPVLWREAFLAHMLSATPQLNCENGHAAGRLFPRAPAPSATAARRGADSISARDWCDKWLTLHIHMLDHKRIVCSLAVNVSLLSVLKVNNLNRFYEMSFLFSWLYRIVFLISFWSNDSTVLFMFDISTIPVSTGVGQWN